MAISREDIPQTSRQSGSERHSSRPSGVARTPSRPTGVESKYYNNDGSIGDEMQYGRKVKIIKAVRKD